MNSFIRSFQSVIGIVPSGFICYGTAHEIFRRRRWPQGSYFDLVLGAYYIP